MASGSRPVSRSVWRSASTIEPRQGCEVRPDMASMAASTASTPASTAASTLAPAMPEVSWVWKWIGRPTSSLSALIRTRAAAGRSRPGHVLDAQDVAAGGLQLLGQPDIVGERVLGAVRIEDVAGVADRTLGELARLAHGVDRDPHVLDPVQAVEDAEQVHPGSRRHAGRSSGRHCRGSWCSRHRWRRAAASAAAGWARARAAAPAAPTDPR